MKALAALGLAALLALAGCAAPASESEAPAVQTVGTSAEVPTTEIARVWTIVVDPAVPPPLVEALRSALRDWQAAVSCGFSFDVVYGQTRGFDEYPLPAAGTIEFRTSDVLPAATASGKVLGYGETYPRFGSRVEVLPTILDLGALAAHVLRHELGHAFGLPHDDLEPSEMGTASKWRSLQAADVENYGQIWCPAINRTGG